MEKNRIALIVLLLLTLFFFSCATKDEIPRNIPEYSEALQTKLKNLLENNKAEAVICYCLNIGDERLDSYQEMAEKKLEERFQAELKDSEYSLAVESLKSLIAIGKETDIQPYEVYYKQILKQIKNNEVMPALLLFKRTFLKKEVKIDIKQEEYKILVDSAIEMHDKQILSYLTNNFKFPEYKLNEINEVLKKTYNTTEMISGSVTIWVDRGIRIESGMGYPDRVIGSGFYIDPMGYLLTNYHVIESEVDKSYEGFSRLYIKYDDSKEKIPAKVVGWDKSIDVALLKVEKKPEYFFNFSEPENYSPGQKIYAIGSPGGLGKTITSGILSISKNRRITPIGDTLQVDVPINSGNSGGPVVDEENNLIGIVFAGIEQFEGVNFVIPSRWVINILPELYKGGKNPQTWLGLTAEEIEEGIEISYICPQTSLFNTDVLSGDKIIKIDDIEVNEITEAQEIVQSKMPGTIIKLTIEKLGKQYDYYIQAELRDDIPMKKAVKLDTEKRLFAPFFGIVVEEAEEKNFIKQYIIKKVYRGSIAGETGLSVNDPFTIVNWKIDDENDIIFVGIRIKKRKAGFLETTIQLGSFVDILNTI